MPDHIKGQHVLKMNNFAFLVKIIIRFGTKIKRIHLSLHWTEGKISWLVYKSTTITPLCLGKVNNYDISYFKREIFTRVFELLINFTNK